MKNLAFFRSILTVSKIFYEKEPMFLKEDYKNIFKLFALITDCLDSLQRAPGQCNDGIQHNVRKFSAVLFSLLNFTFQID